MRSDCSIVNRYVVVPALGLAVWEWVIKILLYRRFVGAFWGSSFLPAFRRHFIGGIVYSVYKCASL